MDRLRDRVGDGPASDDRFYAELGSGLAELDPTTRERVCREYVSAAEAAMTEDVWLAVVTMEGACSADWLESFVYWLVSRGSERYREVCTNPDTLAEIDADMFWEELRQLVVEGAGELDDPPTLPWLRRLTDSELREARERFPAIVRRSGK
ncbi:MAG: DUF4240 domain-containing protein [Sandaracinus sp.]|nr:DUF4240 domain-containing protein [Sandaracinus sp.]